MVARSVLSGAAGTTMNHSWIRNVVLAALTSVAPVVVFQACATPSPNDAALGDDDAGPVDTDPSGGICLLNNCKSDEECGGCEDGRVTCLVAENRCVACDPVSGLGCPDGEACSPFGICAPEGQVCTTDDHGEPTISCKADADCKACSPMHQVCDTAAGKCQACTASNKTHCLAADVCVDGDCAPKCPSSCAGDGDCGQCGGPGNEAHACNNHKCAECSDTFKCPEGLECQSGACVPGCGIAGAPVSGDCTADEDCQYCGGGNAADGWVCKKALNANDPTDHGSCVPQAQGCSDLGKGVAVLPEPWGAVTNTCSSDNDCAGAGIVYNVGKLIRDAIGDDEIDLGFKKVKIQDANVNYDMPKCADIELTESISCGVCVPCETDSDCKPISVDGLVGKLFQGDALAQIAGSVLVDMLYGDTPDHDLNFFCQPVAAGYGVCAPCANPTQACGNGGGGGGGGGGGSCAHDECSAGGKLTKGCSTCTTDVCGSDPYCCSTEWDAQCVDEAKTFGSCGC